MGNILGGETDQYEQHVQDSPAPAPSASPSAAAAAPRKAASSPRPAAGPTEEELKKEALKEATRVLRAFELELERVSSLLTRWIEGRKAKRSRGKKSGGGAKKLKETGLPIPKDGDKAQKKRQFVKAFVDNASVTLDKLQLAGYEAQRAQRRTLLRECESLDSKAAAWLEEKLSEDPMKSGKSSKGKGKSGGARGAASGGASKSRKGRTHVPKAAAGAVPGFEAPEKEGEATQSKKVSIDSSATTAAAASSSSAPPARPLVARTGGPVSAASLGAAAAAEADAVLSRLAAELGDASLEVGHDEGWVAAGGAAPTKSSVRAAAGGSRARGAGRPAPRAAGQGKGGSSSPFVFASGGPMKTSH